MAQHDIDVTAVETTAAAVRLLDTATPDSKNTWTSNEFISLAGTVAVNLITAATVVGWVDATQAQELTKAVTAIAAAVSVISVNGIVFWKYISGKQAVEIQKIQAQYRYAEAVESARVTAASYAQLAAVKPSRRK